MTSQAPGFWPPSGPEIVFLLLVVVALGSALLVVVTRQLVHAALWLVVCFGALAGGYLNRFAAVAVAAATATVLVTTVITGFREAYAPLDPGRGGSRWWS